MFGQPHLIKNLVKKFGDHVKYIQSNKMCDMSKFLIVMPMMKTKNISMEDQREY